MADLETTDLCLLLQVSHDPKIPETPKKTENQD